MKLEVPFDLNFTLCCGQVFRWKKLDGWWYGVVGDQVLKVRQCSCELEFEGVDESFVKYYFGLNDDLEHISRCINKDQYIANALHNFEGLRIVRQVPWECLISFICATYKSIAAIEHMLAKMSQKLGEKRFFDGREFYLFPSIKQLALTSEKELCECGLGYRAKYVQATARRIYEEKVDLETFKRLPYEVAKKRLFEFSGVGLKVADCVLLFSLGKLEAFPVDVWVKRILLNHYFSKLPEDLTKKLSSHDSLNNSEYEKLNAFGRNYFGVYAGYAQEYLYHYERTQS